MTNDPNLWLSIFEWASQLLSMMLLIIRYCTEQGLLSHNIALVKKTGQTFWKLQVNALLAIGETGPSAVWLVVLDSASGNVCSLTLWWRRICVGWNWWKQRIVLGLRTSVKGWTMTVLSLPGQTGHHVVSPVARESKKGKGEMFNWCWHLSFKNQINCYFLKFNVSSLPNLLNLSSLSGSPILAPYVCSKQNWIYNMKCKCKVY